jgi:hypothetical protein
VGKFCPLHNSKMKNISECRMYHVHFIMFIFVPTFVAGVWFDGIKIHFNQIVYLIEHQLHCTAARLSNFGK